MCKLFLLNLNRKNKYIDSVHKTHKSMKKSLLLRIVKVIIPCFSLFFVASLFTHTNAQNVTGKVFRDFDANGQQTSTNPIEPSVAGVTVKAFKADGTQAGLTATTLTDGTYSIAVGTASQIRIEFSNFPSSYYSGPKGSSSGTSVQFVNGGGTANLGINYPSDYCGTTDPKLVTPCYVNGTPLNGGNSANDPFIVTIPYTPTGNGTSASENTYLSKGSEVGATWGMAYQRSSKFIFTSALLKRHSGFGNGGPGAIYKIDVSGGSQVTSLFVDLNTDLSVSAGTDPRNQSSVADSLSKFKTQPNHDATAFGLVGKMSLGDIDISDDEKTLWVINTFDRKLYELPVGSPAVKPTTKIAHTLPDPGCVNGVFRPWAVKFWRGKVYVGGVCTAENSGDSTDLKAFIYSKAPTDANFTQVATFPLNYTRGYTSISSATKKTSAAWKPWIAQWSDITNPAPGLGAYNQTICPQPILSDIEFDVDGSMIVGFMDRAGHQLGNNNYSPIVSDTKTYEGTSAGDLLRMGANSDGTYTLESNATVNGVTSGGANQTPPQGPSVSLGGAGGEFYWQDMYGKNANKDLPNTGGHQEISLGGIAFLAGKNEVVETVFDPVTAFRAGGVRWFDNTTGQAPRAYEIFGQDAGGQGVTFGKANGLGDLELLCASQPIEVGNRLWNDTDKDGIQDAGEPVLTGVTIELWKNGVKIDTKTTDAVTGEYYFTDLIANSTDYEIRLPNISGASKQTQLGGLMLTASNAGSNDELDSDASISGTNTYASITFSTGNAGENNHTLDIGFKCIIPTAKPAGQNVSICEATTTFDLPDAKTGTEKETWTVLTSASNPAAIINASTGEATGMITNGLYEFVLTSDKTGCSEKVSITRSPLPSAGADQIICSPATTAKINASITGQIWSVISKPSGTSPVVAVDGKVTELTAEGVYTFRLTQGDCFEEVQVVRKARPDAGADVTICGGTTISLKAPPSNTNWGVVAVPANPSAASIDNFGDVTGMINNGVYRFVLTSNNGCSDTIQVEKKTGINLTTTDKGVCIAGNLTLTANTTDTGLTFFWQGPVGFTSNQQNPSIANISDANMGVYTVTASSSNGCIATATAKVTLSQITVTQLAGFLNQCVGESLTLRDATVDRKPDEIVGSYLWSGPDGFTATTMNITILAKPDMKQAGVYSLKVTLTNGCFAIATIMTTITKCQKLGNLVWNDSNNDGLNNNGELGVSNVPVKLYDAANPTTSIASTTTDVNGKYLFPNLIPGFYIIEIDAPTGYKSSTGTNGSATGTFEPFAGDPNSDVNDDDDGTKTTGQLIRSKTVELDNLTEPQNDGDVLVGTPSEQLKQDKNSNLTIDFGLFQPAQIGDFVWSDTDKDGIQDPLETTGVNGVIVKLYLGTSISPIATTTTGTDGKYLFDNLIPGTYTVEFVKTSIGVGNSFSSKNSGLTTTDKDSDADLSSGKSNPIVLTAGESNLTIDAGISGDCPGSTVGTITVPALCVGQTLTMKAISSDLNAKYLWSSNASTVFNATTQEVTLPNLTTSNSGTYTVLITNSNLCTSALTANVVVNPIPTIGATGVTICQGLTGAISATGAATYLWTGPNNFTATGANPLVTIPGTYTVLGSQNGCSAIATTTVVVNPNPVLTATGAAICLGGSGTVSIQPAGLTYAWTGPGAFTSSSQILNFTNATNTIAGNYQVVATNTNGCTASATTSVTVGTALTVTPTSNSPVCLGSRLELSATGGTGAKYLWTSPSGFTTTMQNPFTLNSTNADNGVWTVSVENADGCKGIGSTTVVINSTFTGVTASASAPACMGKNITLSSTPSGAVSYEWSGTPTFASSLQNPTLTAPTAGSYDFTVKVTNANGCTAFATASTVIYTAPAASSSSNSPVCLGTSINLIVSTSATKFAWSGPDNFTNSSQNPSILNAKSINGGVYTVVVTNANLCTAMATTNVVINSQLSGGNDLSICSPVSTAQLTLVSGAIWTVEPTNPAPATVNNTGKVSGLSVNGTYVFYLTNTNGCKDTVKVFRNEKLDAGNDVVICSPTSIAKLLKLNTGQTWKYFANGTSQPTPTIDVNGNVSGVTQDGTYLFILEQEGATYCADTVAVIRKPAPNAGDDQTAKTGGGICEPLKTAKLQAAGANQTWSVATNSVGFGTVAIDAMGTITKMETNGIYTFVLTQGDCTDSVKVERIAKPDAGKDVEICADIKTVKLANAPTDMTWTSISTNPVGTLINGTTGEVTGLTTVGEYKFILKNLSGCTDTVSIKTKAVPTFDANTIQATCTIGAANPDAKLILSGFDVANKYDYSEGTTYIGTKTFANATIIPTNGVIANSLLNPTTDKSYTVRVFNNTDCFTDKTIVLKVRACECKPDVCLPYSYKKTK
jgi:hypothetical protein